MSVLADDVTGAGGRGTRAETVRSARTTRVSPGRRDGGARSTARPPRPVHAPRVARPIACAREVPARRWPLLVVLGVSVFLGVLGVGTLAEGVSPPVPERTTVVSIAPGETLWGIANRVAPGSDPEAVVQRIRELNGLSGTGVRAGQPVTVPYQPAG
ncbi:MAG: LysM peptidoglycan-binding domain-containing protein [Pseudonocardiaceae bacterium]|nr:LysM peptidoglycan-binding domain-containing protein [Pseudonocardiaceae bacterium]